MKNHEPPNISPQAHPNHVTGRACARWTMPVVLGALEVRAMAAICLCTPPVVKHGLLENTQFSSMIFPSTPPCFGGIFQQTMFDDHRRVKTKTQLEIYKWVTNLGVRQVPIPTKRRDCKPLLKHACDWTANQRVANTPNVQIAPAIHQGCQLPVKSMICLFYMNHLTILYIYIQLYI